MAPDLISTFTRHCSSYGRRSRFYAYIALGGRNKEETQTSKLSVLGYAVISCSDHGCCESFSELQLIKLIISSFKCSIFKPSIA